jgi:hypothetical protein
MASGLSDHVWTIKELIEREGGSVIGQQMKTLRLALLMLLGAFIGPILLGPGNVSEQLHRHLAENVFHGAILGALCGVAVELCLRGPQLAQKLTWQIRVRNLLLLVGIVATALWIFILLRNY